MTPFAGTTPETESRDFFARARKIADAVLYEGYVLYPYRASARKNQVRWQFGVLAPRHWSEAGGCEEWWSKTECLLEAPLSSQLVLQLRFLQVRQRLVEAYDSVTQTFHPVPSLDVGQLWTAWHEGLAREVDLEISLAELAAGEMVHRFAFGESSEVEELRDAGDRLAGRVVRDQLPLAGDLRLAVEILDIERPLLKVHARVENVSSVADLRADREHALPQFMTAVHLLLAVPGGAFLSLADPPPQARDAAASCRNQRVWPVLIGRPERSDVVLASPIILDDDPQIAPESPGDLCDATEIDEILLLRTMTLTDDEKREARATDPRAAAIIDRADTLAPEILERLHGAIRELRRIGEPEPEPSPPWWNPAAEAAVSPETDFVEVDGKRVAKGTRVRLNPGARRADAQDMFLAGRNAVVQSVFIDVDGKRHVAVTLEDDPAADLHEMHGRFYYFAPDEIEPLEAAR